MKRKIRPYLLILLSVALCAALFACGNKTEEPAVPVTAEEQKTILFLGDSIGEALAGPTPLTEREAYGYYGIIGNINGFDYYNRAVTGYTSADLMEFVEREDDGINMVRSLIKKADIIHISNLGNDFLNSNHSQLMIDLANDVYDRITPRQQAAKEHFESTFATIRSLNPTATILIQTLYNPAGEDSPLVPTYARNYLAARGIGPEEYHGLMNKLIREINVILTEYAEEHTVTDANGNSIPPFEILDVYSAFEEVYETDRARWERLICEDGVHPLSEGHAIIAELIQEKLVSLGFAAPNALHNYKRDKVSQLNRLYAEIPTLKDTRDAIMQATSFGEVSKAYFDATAGYVPHPVKVTKDGKHFEVDKTFDVTLFSVFGAEYTGMLNKKKAEIVFTSTGEYKLYLPVLDLVTAVLKSKISERGEINLNDEFDFDLAIPYFSNFAPGVDKWDLEAILKTIEEQYGFTIVGLDYEKDCVKAMFERYRTTGVLVVDDPNVLDKTVGLLCTGTYTLRTVTDAAGNEFTAVYVNNDIGRGESFIRYTYTKDEDAGEEKVRATVDVIRIALEGTLKTEE